MAFRSKAAALVITVLCAVAGLASTASASPISANACSTDNSCATVAGVTGHASNNSGGADCGLGNLCLYTGQNFTGTRFDLFTCKTYYLSQWNGYGSDYNNYAVAAIHYGQTGSMVGGLGPNSKRSSYNFYPVWSVKNC
jgi:hypothetical protein